MENIPLCNKGEFQILSLDAGIDLLSGGVEVVSLWAKGPPYYDNRLLAQNNKHNPAGEVFFYDPYEKHYPRLRLMGHIAECSIDITEPGTYTFWLEVSIANLWLRGGACDVHFK